MMFRNKWDKSVFVNNPPKGYIITNHILKKSTGHFEGIYKRVIRNEHLKYNCMMTGVHF